MAGTNSAHSGFNYLSGAYSLRLSLKAHVMSRLVLVVDDELLLLEIVCAMLEELGCEPVCVDCPVKGLAKIEADPRIAMVITDVQMPAMDGFELANRVKAQRPDLPVVLMSGRDLGRPGYPVMKKPFSQRQLAELIAPIAHA